VNKNSNLGLFITQSCLMASDKLGHMDHLYDNLMGFMFVFLEFIILLHWGKKVIWFGTTWGWI